MITKRDLEESNFKIERYLEYVGELDKKRTDTEKKIDLKLKNAMNRDLIDRKDFESYRMIVDLVMKGNAGAIVNILTEQKKFVEFLTQVPEDEIDPTIKIPKPEKTEDEFIEALKVGLLKTKEVQQISALKARLTRFYPNFKGQIEKILEGNNIEVLKKKEDILKEINRIESEGGIAKDEEISLSQ